MSNSPILPSPLQTRIAEAIDAAGGWLGFDQFMALALYAPGLGYYANASRKFGRMPAGGSDFVTAPELSPRFGQALARQAAQALAVSGTTEIWEFGAGSGALAQQILEAIGPQLERYTIVDVSGSLVQRQRERLAAHAGKVYWATELPPQMRGVVVGNEVLDAMPVKLLARLNGVWHERGVVMAPTLVASRTALPPEGAELAWGGPALRSLASCLGSKSIKRCQTVCAALTEICWPTMLRASVLKASPPDGRQLLPSLGISRFMTRSFLTRCLQASVQ